jgi:co-chaperonin GroES (HSP10)
MLSFQEMQVNTQPFSINIIELTNKKVLVRPEMSDKDKGKGIIIGDPHTTKLSQGVVAQMAPNKKTNKTEGARGKGDRTADQSSMSRASCGPRMQLEVNSTNFTYKHTTLGIISNVFGSL